MAMFLVLGAYDLNDKTRNIEFNLLPIGTILWTATGIVLYLATNRHALFNLFFAVMMTAGVLMIVCCDGVKQERKKYDTLVSGLTMLALAIWQCEVAVCQGGDYRGLLTERSERFGAMYEYDPLLWCHPIWHVLCYSACTYILHQSILRREDQKPKTLINR